MEAVVPEIVNGDTICTRFWLQAMRAFLASVVRACTVKLFLSW